MIGRYYFCLIMGSRGLKGEDGMNSFSYFLSDAVSSEKVERGV